MSPIIKNPTDVRARYANRLAHQHYAVREAWRANKSPELAAIMAAWMNPGPHPGYHRAMQAEVHRTMPVLAAALERAARDAARNRREA